MSESKENLIERLYSKLDAAEVTISNQKELMDAYINRIDTLQRDNQALQHHLQRMAEYLSSYPRGKKDQPYHLVMIESCHKAINKIDIRDETNLANAMRKVGY